MASDDAITVASEAEALVLPAGVDSSTYIPYKVYTNLYIFLQKYRKLVPAAEPIKRDEFIRMIQQQQYVLIDAAPADPDTSPVQHVYIYLMAKTVSGRAHKYASSANFEQLIDAVARQVKEAKFDPKHVELIFVSEYKEGLSQTLKKMVEIKHSTTGMRIHDYAYMHFMYELPACEQCDPHEILLQEEVDRLKRAKVLPENNPTIFESDPMAFWIGARRGQILRVLSRSYTTGQAIRYRKVV